MNTQYIPQFHLAVSIHKNCTLAPEAAADKLFLGMMCLLQFDGNPLQHFADIEVDSDNSIITTAVKTTNATISVEEGSMYRHQNTASSTAGTQSKQSEEVKKSEEEVVHKKDSHPPQSVNPVMCLVGVATTCALKTSLLLRDDENNIEKLKFEIGEGKSSSRRHLYQDWEIRYAEAVLAMVSEFNFDKAIDIATNALLKTPLDIFSTRLLFLLFIWRARYTEMRDLFNGLIPIYHEQQLLSEKDNGEMVVYPYVLVMAAFGLEEAAQHDPHLPLQMCYEAIDCVEALNKKIEMIKKKGSEVEEDTSLLASLGGQPLTHPYAVHVVCHCYLALDDPKAGIDALEKINENLWKPTLHVTCHIWWHKALFHYDLGDKEKSLSVFDQEVVRYVNKVDLFSLCDATALLWRMFIDDAISPKDPRICDLIANWQYQVSEEAQLNFPVCRKEKSMIIMEEDSGKNRKTENARMVEIPRLSLVPFFAIHFRCVQILADFHRRTKEEEQMKEEEEEKVVGEKEENSSSSDEHRKHRSIERLRQLRHITLQDLDADRQLLISVGEDGIYTMEAYFLTVVFCLCQANEGDEKAGGNSPGKGKNTEEFPAVTMNQKQSLHKAFDALRIAKEKGHWHKMGGSNAQRDLLARTFFYLAFRVKKESATQQTPPLDENVKMTMVALENQLRGLGSYSPKNPHHQLLLKKF